MTIIVFGSFDYWCDGRCTQDFVERSDTEMSIITETAERCAWHNYGYRIDEVIGNNAEALTVKIHQATEYIIAEKERLEEVDKLKRWIKHSEEWLAKVDEEIVRHTTSLIRDKARLSEID